ncbi:MAG: DUF45 domain-containing protein, partial [Atopobiaceae bacterium]|nr:DUF45 domain-containing protein [Atopobiaceae bacterium]
MARRKAAATQSFDLVISNMPVHIERKNIRRAWLRVKADGSVQVSAPYTMSTKKLNEFVSSHTGWIEQQQLKQQARRAHTAQWLEGEKLSLWGVNYPIRW